MASSLTKVRTETEDALNAQVAELRKELSSITKVLSKQGLNLADTAHDSASELYDIVRERGVKAAEEVGKHAKVVRETARDNPLATVAIIAGVSLLIGLIARR